MVNSVPTYSVRLVDGRGVTDPTWYRYFQQLGRSLNATGDDTSALAKQIKVIAEKLGALDGSAGSIPEQPTAFVINSDGSIAVDGTPASGVVNITLKYDTEFPGNTAYYGTGSDGQRGWFAVSAALEGSETIGLSTGADGITRFELTGFGDLTTDDLAEGSDHLYFTDERAQAAVRPIFNRIDAGGDIRVDAEGNLRITY